MATTTAYRATRKLLKMAGIAVADMADSTHGWVEVMASTIHALRGSETEQNVQIMIECKELEAVYPGQSYQFRAI
jgi:hypothetical protein